MSILATAVRDILLPRTDAGAFAQAIVIIPALVLALVLVRADHDVRLFVAGLLVFAVAFFALRTVH